MKKKQPETIGQYRLICFGQNLYAPCTEPGCGVRNARMFYKLVKADHFTRSVVRCEEHAK